MIILALGSIASAMAPSFVFLIVARAVMGVGIGGDYPTSATIMSEFSNRKNRGRLVAMVFSLQGVGILVGIAVAFTLLAFNVPSNLIWRIMLGFGASARTLRPLSEKADTRNAQVSGEQRQDGGSQSDSAAHHRQGV